jgi:hypothetical protein
MCWSRKTKTESGVKISANKVPGLPSQAAYDRALEVLIKECARHMDEAAVKKALNGVTVEWWDRIAPRPSTGELNTVVVYEDKVYSGLTLGSMCKVAWRGKIHRSAFCHELLHIIGGRVLGDTDPSHSNTLLWKTINGQANARLKEEDI